MTLAMLSLLLLDALCEIPASTGNAPGSLVTGFLIGVFGSAFNLGAMWGAIRLMTKSVERQPTSKIGGVLLTLGFLVKLPLIVGLGYFCMKQGQPMLNGFLLGLAVVYTALFAYALWDGQQKAARSNQSYRYDPPDATDDTD